MYVTAILILSALPPQAPRAPQAPPPAEEVSAPAPATEKKWHVAGGYVYDEERKEHVLRWVVTKDDYANFSRKPWFDSRRAALLELGRIEEQEGKVPPKKPAPECDCPGGCRCPGSAVGRTCDCSPARSEAPCSKLCTCGCNDGGYCTCPKVKARANAERNCGCGGPNCGCGAFCDCLRGTRNCSGGCPCDRGRRRGAPPTAHAAGEVAFSPAAGPAAPCLTVYHARPSFTAAPAVPVSSRATHEAAPALFTPPPPARQQVAPQPQPVFAPQTYRPVPAWPVAYQQPAYRPAYRPVATARGGNC